MSIMAWQGKIKIARLCEDKIKYPDSCILDTPEKDKFGTPVCDE